MSSLISKSTLFSTTILTSEIIIVLIDVKNKKTIDKYGRKIIGKGVEIINKLIRADALIKHKTSKLKIDFPTFEEIYLLGYVFPVMKEFFPKEENLTQFFFRLKENLTTIQSGGNRNLDELKNFFSGLGKEIRKELAVYEYANENEDD